MTALREVTVSDTLHSPVTIEEVASAAGVSRSTVSRVVNGSTAVSPAALAAVRRACGDPDFNLVMYSAPTNGGHAEEVFHWHLKMIPRIATQAGFEIGSAMSINTVAPEDAASSLRTALHP